MDEILMDLQNCIAVIHKLFMNEHVRKVIIQGIKNIFMAFRITEAKYSSFNSIEFTVRSLSSTSWLHFSQFSNFKSNKPQYLNSLHSSTLNRAIPIMSSCFPQYRIFSLVFITKTDFTWKNSSLMAVTKSTKLSIESFYPCIKRANSCNFRKSMRAHWKDKKNQLQWKNLRFTTLLVKGHLKREWLNWKGMT